MFIRIFSVSPLKLHLLSGSKSCSKTGFKDSTNSLRQICISAGRCVEIPDISGSNDSASNGKSNSKGHQSSERFQSIKEQILRESLNFVPKHGWSQEALAEGANVVGFPKVAHGMFPSGGVELVNHFYEDCNKRLVVHMEEHALQGDRQKQQVTEMIRSSVRVRLEMITPHLNVWPQALAMLATPSNLNLTMRNLYTLVDDVWYYAGDRSVNSNFYIRRLGLASLYTTTELVFVQDKSIDFVDTWNYLDRHVQRMEGVGESLKTTGKVIDGLPQFLSGTVTTLRNVAGLRFM